MHLVNSQDDSEFDEFKHDAPSSSESDNDILGNVYRDDADNESSDNDDEYPYNADAFINPVFDIDDLNFDEEDDDMDYDSNDVDEDPFEGNIDGWNFNDVESESSESNQQILREIDQPNDVQQSAIRNHTNEDFNNQQQESSRNPQTENSNDPQPGTSGISQNQNFNDSQAGPSRYLDNGTRNSEQEDGNNRQQGTSNIENDNSQNTENEYCEKSQPGAASIFTMHFCANSQQCESCNPEYEKSNYYQKPTEVDTDIDENHWVDNLFQGCVSGSSEESVGALSITIPDSSYCYPPYNTTSDYDETSYPGYQSSYYSPYRALGASCRTPPSSIEGTISYPANLPTYPPILNCNFTPGTSAISSSRLSRYDALGNPNYETQRLPIYGAAQNLNYQPPLSTNLGASQNNGYIIPTQRHYQHVPSVNSHLPGHRNTHSYCAPDSNTYSSGVSLSYDYSAPGSSSHGVVGLSSDSASPSPGPIGLGRPSYVSRLLSSDNAYGSIAMHYNRSRYGAQETWNEYTPPRFSSYGTPRPLNYVTTDSISLLNHCDPQHSRFNYLVYSSNGIPADSLNTNSNSYDVNCRGYVASGLPSSDSLTQISISRNARFNTGPGQGHGQDSARLPSYWISYKFNFQTLFDSTGYPTNRDEQAILRFFITGRRYIPVVRLQSEGISDRGDNIHPEFQPGPSFSNGQSGGQAPPSSGLMPHYRSFFNPGGGGRGRGRGRDLGLYRGHGRSRGRSRGHDYEDGYGGWFMNRREA